MLTLNLSREVSNGLRTRVFNVWGAINTSLIIVMRMPMEYYPTAQNSNSIRNEHIKSWQEKSYSVFTLNIYTVLS